MGEKRIENMTKKEVNAYLKEIEKELDDNDGNKEIFETSNKKHYTTPCNSPDSDDEILEEILRLKESTRKLKKKINKK